MVVNVISIMASSICLITCEAANPTAAPIKAPKPTILRKSVTICPVVTLAPVTRDRLSVKNTIAVPSLSRLSPSSKTDKRRGTPRLRNTATTAIGSVAAINAPKTSA